MVVGGGQDDVAVAREERARVAHVGRCMLKGVWGLIEIGIDVAKVTKLTGKRWRSLVRFDKMLVLSISRLKRSSE